MTVYQINPLQDPRWNEFLLSHPRASIFHTPGWLEALRHTYGYEPIVLTTSAPSAELRNGLAACLVNSRLTGHRVVSLPFSDHCEPLVDDPDDLASILTSLQEGLVRDKWSYIELRPVGAFPADRLAFAETNRFWLHRLDMTSDLEQLYRGFHRDCVQRKIRRADRESLTCEEGATGELMKKFYHLLILTRRRHLLPPPPFGWFRNVIEAMGKAAMVHVASKGDWPVAAILTLSFKRDLIYKYSCSNARFSQLGGTQLLLWKAIQKAKREGLLSLDMGRSDYDATGLVSFKSRWGSVGSELTYWRYPAGERRVGGGRESRVARGLFKLIPCAALEAAGSLLYRHVG